MEGGFFPIFCGYELLIMYHIIKRSISVSNELTFYFGGSVTVEKKPSAHDHPYQWTRDGKVVQEHDVDYSVTCFRQLIVHENLHRVYSYSVFSLDEGKSQIPRVSAHPVEWLVEKINEENRLLRLHVGSRIEKQEQR